jgi:8-oxo-dGTP pyrophosphatase MutT (NUDIX family)
VTSRRGKGLVFPKGRLEWGRTFRQIAVQEAWEEAGLVGVLRAKPLGSYRYQKAGTRFEVVTFLMDVTDVLMDWPESYMRTRYWLPPAEVPSRVRERGLRKLLRKALTDGLGKAVTWRAGPDQTGWAGDTREVGSHEIGIG